MMGAMKDKLRKFYDVKVRRSSKRIEFYKFMEQGGEGLRLDYQLAESDIVFDIGGYVGHFARDIAAKFNCAVDVFEPIARYAEEARRCLAQNNKVNVVQAGLGATNKEVLISVAGLGSSVFSDCQEETEEIKILSIIDYIEANHYDQIGLMKINVEGGEFEIFEALFAQPELLARIKYFQVQFHDFVPEALSRRVEIQQKLSETHTKMWDFPFIWESWEIKKR